MKALSYDIAVNGRAGSKRQVGKNKGQVQNAVASMAYALGETLYDEQEQDLTKQRKSYSRKEEVTHSEIIAPEGAPEWVFNPQELANRVERSETRKNSQLLRSHILALPNELDHEARLSVARDFAQHLADTGQVVAFALHDAPGNAHTHFLCTMRELDATGPEGFSKKKQRDWNEFQIAGKEKQAPNLTDQYRGWLETRVNDEMEKAGHSTRIIYSSYEANGIDKEPTHHIGPAAAALEKREIDSERKAENVHKVKQKNAVKDAVRGERSEADFADAAVALDKEKQQQEREQAQRERAARREQGAQRKPRENRKHRDALERSRKAPQQQWERARVIWDTKPQHDKRYLGARKLQGFYVRQARQERLEENVIPEPSIEGKERHARTLGAAMRAGLARAGQGTATMINRVRGFLAREPGPDRTPEPERGPQRKPGRGSVYDALKRQGGTDTTIETARNAQHERERRYER